MAEQSVTRVRLRNVRASYPNVFAPKKNDEGVDKYSMALLMDRNDPYYKENKAAYDKAVEHLLNEAGPKLGWKKDTNGKWKGMGSFKLPWRDGDDKSAKNPEYEGCDFVNAASNNRPGLFNIKGGKPITEESGDFYAGCYCHVVVNFYLFGLKPGSKSTGIAVGLENIMKCKDGENLSGKGRATVDEFTDLLEDDDDDDDFKPL
jgi:hypothetical protein